MTVNFRAVTKKKDKTDLIYDQLVDQFFLYSGLYIRFRLGPSVDFNSFESFWKRHKLKYLSLSS